MSFPQYNLQNNKFQGQVSSFCFSDPQDLYHEKFRKNDNIVPNDHYFSKIGIYAPPGSQFNIGYGNGNTITITIGHTFMYQIEGVMVTSLEYLGNVNKPVEPETTIDEYNQEYVLSNADKRIVIDFIDNVISSQ